MALTDGALYKASYDPEVEAAYIQISDKPVARTSQFHGINIDLSATGEVVGIEVL